MKILLTGGAGYIGSHVLLSILEKKYEAVVVDDLSTGHESLVPEDVRLIKCNINDKDKISNIVQKEKFDVLLHFAGFIRVEESVQNPVKYFKNNTENAITLFETCFKNNLKNIIFSSTAAAYGSPSNNDPIKEEASLNPLNPYGQSKIETEDYLIKNADKFNSIILRYFNVAGADPKLRSGLISKEPTHLIKILSEVAVGKRDKIYLYGNDYNTNDGTAVRDYIHVSDLADIHIKTAEYLIEKKVSNIFNCGYGRGYSVLEVVKEANKITGDKIKYEFSNRRPGDAEKLISNIDKLSETINWEPKFNDLNLIIKTAINWEKKLMKKIFKRSLERNDKRELLLFGYSEHQEKPSKELEITPAPTPHMRWNPSRQEWVTYSATRKVRTSFPPEEYCPLCPGAELNFPTEIPFKNFEIAIFPNRWASFNTNNRQMSIEGIDAQPSNGECEVVVYSSNHKDTIAQMSLDRVELLFNAWSDRYINLMKRDDIKYVMPFENRGIECGVTLHHPHGQIYAYPIIPPVIQKEIEAFSKENFIEKLMKNLEQNYYVYQDDYVIAAIPPFARYAYEVWIIPKRKLAGPWQFTDQEYTSFAIALQKVVKGYDDFLGRRCPYIMGLHAAPALDDNNFHFHMEFYPPLRHGDKPKVLAGSESMAGVFIMDVLPEESAAELRKYIS